MAFDRYDPASKQNGEAFAVAQVLPFVIGKMRPARAAFLSPVFVIATQDEGLLAHARDGIAAPSAPIRLIALSLQNLVDETAARLRHFQWLSRPGRATWPLSRPRGYSGNARRGCA